MAFLLHFSCDIFSQIFPPFSQNKILENTLVEPKFKEYENILEKADYLINQSIDQGTIDNDLNKIQKKLENELK